MKDKIKAINATYLFTKYVAIKNWKHKLRGTDGNGKPIEFSLEEKKEIVAGLKTMLKDVIANINSV